MRAHDLLKDSYSQTENFQVAEHNVLKLNPARRCREEHQVNDNYFSRTFTYQMMNKATLRENARKAPCKKRESAEVSRGEWSLFKSQVRRYREEEEQKFKEDRDYFDKVLQRRNQISSDQQQLIPSVTTTIIREPNVTQENMIKVTKERQFEQFGAPEEAADIALEEQFIELINT